MYKIIKAQGKDGTDKLRDIEKIHSLVGELELGKYACFIYNDDSGKMMRTSTIEDVKYFGNRVIVTTRNSEYWFEEVEE